MTNFMSASPDPLSAFWRPTVLASILLGGEALALIVSLAPSRDSERLVSFGLHSLTIQWIVLGTLCALYILRRQLSRIDTPYIAWIGLALLLANTALVSAAAWGLLAPAIEMGETRASFMARAMAIALIVGVLALVAYQNYWQARHLAVRAKQLELEALQARIHPHFLFNTLNTSIALLHAKPDEAERVLLDLADLFRSALRGPRIIPLSEELALTRRYLEIESLRFGDRLQVQWRVPDVIPDVATPSLSIQPLAENAIRHGIEQRGAGGQVQINVQIEAQRVVITLINPLPDGASSKPEGHSVGLASARERVRDLTAGHGQLEAGVQGAHYVARMSLPITPSMSATQATTS